MTSAVEGARQQRSHERVLVPLTDVGLVAEALVYFDRISLWVTGAEPLATLLDWFVAPGEVETFLIWLRDGAVEFIDADETASAAFKERVLEHPRIAALMKGQYRHARLLSFSKDRVHAVESVRLLHAAVERGSDLYLDSVAAADVRTELASRTRVESFGGRVKFQPVRELVNEGRMDLREVIELRRKSRPLRDWLQGEDRTAPQAFLAIHDAIGQASTASSSRELRWHVPEDRQQPLFFDAG